MKQVKAFLAETRWTTRIRLIGWVFALCLTLDINVRGAATAFYLLPALLTELRKNPVFEQSQNFGVRVIKGSKSISRIAFITWMFICAAVSADRLSVFLEAVIIFGILFAPIVIGVEVWKNPVLRERRIQCKQDSSRDKLYSKVDNLVENKNGEPVQPHTPGATPVERSKNLEQRDKPVVKVRPFTTSDLERKRQLWEHGGKERLAKWRRQIKTETLNGNGECSGLDNECDERTALVVDLRDALLKIQKKKEIYWNKYRVNVCDIRTVDFVDGHAFEHFCADLLRDNGYEQVSVTPGSGDQGADIIAIKNDVRYAIQCKHKEDPHSSKYGNKPIQEVFTGMSFYKCQRGAVITNGYFSSGGQNVAKATGVELWDRDALVGFLESAGFKQESQESLFAEGENNSYGNVEMAQELFRDEGPNFESKTSVELIDGIDVHIDFGSFNYFGLSIKDIAIDKDDPESEGIELLFDVISAGRKRNEVNVDVVCNLYDGKRKLETQTWFLDMDKFHGRDSLSITFEKKNIRHRANRIEVYCKEW